MARGILLGDNWARRLATFNAANSTVPSVGALGWLTDYDCALRAEFPSTTYVDFVLDFGSGNTARPNCCAVFNHNLFYAPDAAFDTTITVESASNAAITTDVSVVGIATLNFTTGEPVWRAPYNTFIRLNLGTTTARRYFRIRIYDPYRDVQVEPIKVGQIFLGTARAPFAHNPATYISNPALAVNYNYGLRQALEFSGYRSETIGGSLHAFDIAHRWRFDGVMFEGLAEDDVRYLLDQFAGGGVNRLETHDGQGAATAIMPALLPLLWVPDADSLLCHYVLREGRDFPTVTPRVATRYDAGPFAFVEQARGPVL